MSITAMKQMVEALEYAQTGNRRPEVIGAAITAGRQAIAEAEKQEPYARIYETEGPFGLHQSLDYRPYNGRNPDRVVPVYTHPQPKQEPVAWLSRRYVDNFPASGYETTQPTDHGAFPVYTHPQPKEPKEPKEPT
jgi:hypothetical protein